MPGRISLAALLAAGLAYLGPQAASAQAEFFFEAEAALELRAFAQSARPGKEGARLQPSLYLQPEFEWEWARGDTRVTFIPFAQIDRHDNNRTHADIQELNYLYLGDGWDIVAGINKVFWGVTESFHLVDIINQDDAVRDLDGEDKLGQPMLATTWFSDYGAFRLFVLPGFRTRTFPDGTARLSAPLLVDDDGATFDSAAEELHTDFALRWSHFIGAFDIGIAHFHGTSRDPRLIPVATSTGPQLRPHYDQIDQTSLDLQYTLGATLWKFEGIYRTGHGDPFFAFVGGFEHTLYGIFGTRGDLGLLAEWLFDDREETLSAPVTLFENDIFAGARWAWNDEDDTSLLAGGIVDVETGGIFWSAEAERRIAPNWFAELEGRFFSGLESSDPAAPFRRDDFINLRLTRYF